MRTSRYFTLFLLAHIAMVSVHALVNTTGKINSWEFGGYAMYTTIPARVKPTIVRVSPEREALPKTTNMASHMSFRLSSGGCVFGFDDEGYVQLGRDMLKLDLREMEILFERQQFSDDKTVILYEEMMRIKGRMTTDGRIEIDNTVCGSNETKTVKFQ